MDEPPSFVFVSSFFSLLLALTGIVLLMAFCALIAMGETACFTLNPDSIAGWSKSTNRRERLLFELMRDTVRLRITLALSGIFYKVLTVVLWLFVIGGFDLENQNVVQFTVLVSACLIFLCDLMPRLYARKHNRRVAGHLSGFLTVLVRVSSPAVSIAIRLRAKWKDAFKENKPSREELTQALEMAAANDPVVDDERDILLGIVNFGSLTVKQLMKGREAISAISIDASFVELISHINRCGYSRIPVFNKNIDNIVGVIYVKDLLPFLDNSTGFNWPSILRPGFFVTETKKIDLLLKDFQEKRVHMALVKDLTGNITGLITLENLIEEIIGEINDESDEIEDSGYRKIDENTFVFDGRTPIHEFFRVLDQEHPFLREPGDHESLEDFIIEFNDDVPGAGDELYYEQFTFVIEAMEQKRIKRVRVNIHAQA